MVGAAARLGDNSAMTSLRFTKGHGTENDFVLVPDLDGTLGDRLTDASVRLLCDRRAGIGADGIIRVVPTSAAEEVTVREQAGAAPWFMDYRNADGSRAQMCGNGSRVFAAYLRREGLETGGHFSIATRSGVKQVHFEGENISIDLGPWELADPLTAAAKGFDATVVVPGGPELSGLSVDMGNPHTVAVLPAEIDLDRLDLSRPPVVFPRPQDGTNVEIVHVIGPGRIRLRVHERGVGETRSCGTGACAAALATKFWQGAGAPNEWSVEVPGGTLVVRAVGDSGVELVGPAALVADGVTTLIG